MRRVDKKAFGGRVAARRATLGVSGRAVAQAVGMSQQGIDNIEHGKSGRPRLLQELAEALGTTQNWLLWGEGPEESANYDPAEQIRIILQSLNKAKLPVVIRYLKTIVEDDPKAA